MIWKTAIRLISALLLMSASSSYADTPYFQIEKEIFTKQSIEKDNPGALYEKEMELYSAIHGIAREKFLEHFWGKKARSQKKTVEAVQKEYYAQNIKVQPADVNAAIEKLKEYPAFKKLSPTEMRTQATELLKDREKKQLEDTIVMDAIKKGELKILMPEPQKPTFKLTISENDHVRYDLKSDKPVSCKCGECPIHIVEYTEFQCPFCARFLPTMAELFQKYPGKICAVSRNFPLSFHDRARPAAKAAICAGRQGKYWEMYYKLFENQKALADSDFEKYAQGISGMDMAKFKTCYTTAKDLDKEIDEHLASGMKYGVNGTPASFVSATKDMKGVRYSGAVPAAEIIRGIEEALAAAPKVEEKKKG